MTEWEKFKRTDKVRDFGKPFISISASRISFTSEFVKMAKIEACTRINVLVSQEEKKLGFIFHSNAKEVDSFSLFKDNQSRAATIRGILKQNPWLQKIASRPANERKFTPEKEGELWVIKVRLMAF